VGCGNPTSQSASDCAAALRLDATTYVERGFTHHPASRSGTAEDSECEDVGADPRGVYFPEDPRTVDVWSFDGQDPLEVLGVRESQGRFQVFIARHVSTADAAEILDALGDSSVADPHR
jgi:hypothetical protein